MPTITRTFLLGLLLWTMSCKQEALVRFEVTGRPVRGLAVFEGRGIVAGSSGFADRPCLVMRDLKGKIIWQRECSGSGVTALQRFGTDLVVGTDQGIEIVDSKEGRVRQKILDGAFVSRLAVGPEGQLAAGIIRGSDSHVVGWRQVRAGPKPSFDVRIDGLVHDLKFGRSNSLLLVLTSKVKALDFRTGQPIGKELKRPHSLARAMMAADGRHATIFALRPGHAAFTVSLDDWKVRQEPLLSDDLSAGLFLDRGTLLVADHTGHVKILLHGAKKTVSAHFPHLPAGASL